MSTAPAMLLSSRCIQGPERTSIVKSEAGADLSTPLETQLESVLRAGSGPFLASLPLLPRVTLQREETVRHREQAHHGTLHQEQHRWASVQ